MSGALCKTSGTRSKYNSGHFFLITAATAHPSCTNRSRPDKMTDDCQFLLQLRPQLLQKFANPTRHTVTLSCGASMVMKYAGNESTMIIEGGDEADVRTFAAAVETLTMSSPTAAHLHHVIRTTSWERLAVLKKLSAQYCPVLHDRLLRDWPNIFVGHKIMEN